MKYKYLNIDKEILLNGLKEIQKLCNIINNHSYLSCHNCPLEYCCDSGLLSLIIMDDEEQDRVDNKLINIDLLIRNDEMTF